MPTPSLPPPGGVVWSGCPGPQTQRGSGSRVAHTAAFHTFKTCMGLCARSRHDVSGMTVCEVRSRSTCPLHGQAWQVQAGDHATQAPLTGSALERLFPTSKAPNGPNHTVLLAAIIQPFPLHPANRHDHLAPPRSRLLLLTARPLQPTAARATFAHLSWPLPNIHRPCKGCPTRPPPTHTPPHPPGCSQKPPSSQS